MKEMDGRRFINSDRGSRAGLSSRAGLPEQVLQVELNRRAVPGEEEVKGFFCVCVQE